MDDLNNKITKAQERIEQIYHETDGRCYLSFSGGKDSTVILALIKQCESLLTIPKGSIPAVFCNTGIELGATVDFVNWVKDNWYHNVKIIRPKVSFYWILKNKGYPLKSKMKSDFIGRYQRKPQGTALKFLLNSNNQYAKIGIANKDMHLLHPNFNINISDSCCRYLKKKPFEKYQKDNKIQGYILGERLGEGGARQLSAEKRIKTGGKLCTKSKGRYIIKFPIIDWTDQDIEDFIIQYHVPLSVAYTERGYERTGCFLCPFSLQLEANLQKLYQYEPNRYKAAIHWLKDVYIAQNVCLPFDPSYERERLNKWETMYGQMRYEMLKRYKPEVCEKWNRQQITLF